MDVESFAVIIKDFGLVPYFMAKPVAIILPIIEIIAAAGLIFDMKGSLITISGLLLFFIAILLYAIAMGLDIDCGCFGPEDPEAKAYSSIYTSLYRDLLMLAGVSFLYLWRFKKVSRNFSEIIL